jgi:RimJ/RimL family protein N-acetyltransferase
MRHSITLAGLAFRLRPIADADAPLVLELRGNAKLNQYLHATSRNVGDQLAWFARYYERPGDYYFVIERQDSGASEGVISVYDIDSQSASGEWGRWIIRPGSLAAIESAWLIYRCAFEHLGLDRVYCRTVANNEKVLSFHDSCGITDRRLLPGHFELCGKPADAVEHRVTRQTWGEIELRLKTLAQLTARRIQRG